MVSLADFICLCDCTGGVGKRNFVCDAHSNEKVHLQIT